MANNLKLNSTKSTEMIVSRLRMGREHLTYPTLIPGIQRIDLMKICLTVKHLSRLMHISTLLLDRQRSRCKRSEFSVHTVLLGKPFGTSPALPYWPECCMHHWRWWGYAEIWAIDSSCKTSYSNYRGWDFCHAIPLHLKICVAPLMKSFLHPCSGTSTMYWHNSFLRLEKPQYQLRPHAHNRSLPVANNLMRKIFFTTHAVQRFLLNYISSF